MEMLPTALRLAAAGTSATSAFAAYPIASDMFGAGAGAVIVFSCAATVFAGWHFVGTPSPESDSSQTQESQANTKTKDIAKRVLSGSIAMIFATAMVAGIHASASQPAVDSKARVATASDKLYSEQETSRINTLAKLTEELRVTSKRNNPDEYGELQTQIARLSVPTPRQQSASEQAPTAAGDVYSWAVAAAFEVVTPALLILAGLFSSRKPKSVAVATQAAAATTGNSQQVIDSIELTQLSPATTSKVEADDVQEALAARKVAINADGNVTAAAVEALTGCTSRQARKAIATAVANGYLTKTGSGGSTRYSYPVNKLRSIK